MTKLYCGHEITPKFYAAMYKARVMRCPRCGLSWKGYQVINRDKGKPKRDLREAERMGRMSSREFFKGDRKPRK